MIQREWIQIVEEHSRTQPRNSEQLLFMILLSTVISIGRVIDLWEAAGITTGEKTAGKKGLRLGSKPIKRRNFLLDWHLYAAIASEAQLGSEANK